MKKIAVLRGDGIGPEVMHEALRVLEAVQEKFNLKFEIVDFLVGGASFDKYGEHLTNDTIKGVKSCDAILFGSVGGPITESSLPKWKNCERNTILKLRKELNFFANLRPIKLYPELKEISPLKWDNNCVGEILIFRELLSGIYFGKQSTGSNKYDIEYATDECYYNSEEITRIAELAFTTAKNLNKKLTLVHKANVLATSKLWQKVVANLASTKFEDVNYSEILVDNCAMQLVINPSQFEIILTSNMFGDILSDLASAIPGSLGLTPSASFSLTDDSEKKSPYLYEPSGGSAPDIANLGIANPTAQILCVAMMMLYSFNHQECYKVINKGVEETFKQGFVTKELYKDSKNSNFTVKNTKEFTDVVIANIKKQI